MIQRTLTERAVEAALQANVPYVEWGPPGIGKTYRHRALIKRALGWPMEEILIATMEPADIVGMPKAADRGYVRLAPPWATRLYEATEGGTQPGVMFFDEISCATPAQQSPVMAIAHDRRVGDLQFGAEIRFVAAANPPHQAAGGWDLALPLANRLVHFVSEPSAMRFVEALRAGFPLEAPYEPAPNWRGQIPVWRSHVAAFLTRRPALALVVPSGDEAEATLSWPSYRSWDNLTRLLACGERDPELALPLALATVGEGAATEFLAWLRKVDLPDPRDVIVDPSIVGAPGPDDDHRVYAIVSSVVTLVESLNVSPSTPAYTKLWLDAWSALHRIAGHSAEIVAPFVIAIGECRPPSAPMPQSFTDFARRMGKAMGVAP